MYARVGRGVPTAVMKRVIRENFGPASKTHPLLRFLEPERVPAAEDTLVFLNGTFFAVTQAPEALESAILSMRRSENLAFETRVAWDTEWSRVRSQEPSWAREAKLSSSPTMSRLAAASGRSPSFSFVPGSWHTGCTPVVRSFPTCTRYRPSFCFSLTRLAYKGSYSVT